MMTVPVLIEVEHLVAEYGERRILDDISFSVVEGEILVVLGASGSGKSTLLKVLSGAHRPDSGQMTLEQRRFQRRPSKRRD